MKQTVSGGSPLITTLPPAAPPNREVYTIVHTFGGTYADLAIAPDGRVGGIGPKPPAAQDFSFVSLEGITYQPANGLPTTPVQINGSNWTDTFSPNNPGFGASPAAWYKDGSGIVHLQGAADQWQPTSVNGSDPLLLGTLPPPAAPARVVGMLGGLEVRDIRRRSRSSPTGRSSSSPGPPAGLRPFVRVARRRQLRAGRAVQPHLEREHRQLDAGLLQRRRRGSRLGRGRRRHRPPAGRRAPDLGSRAQCEPDRNAAVDHRPDTDRVYDRANVRAEQRRHVR